MIKCEQNTMKRRELLTSPLALIAPVELEKPLEPPPLSMFESEGFTVMLHIRLPLPETTSIEVPEVTYARARFRGPL